MAKARDDIETALRSFPPTYASRVRERVRELCFFEGIGLLPREAYQEKLVLDWEAGDAAFSIAMLLRGAKTVVAIDSWASEDAIPTQARSIEGFSFERVDIARWEQLRNQDLSAFDLVFSNTVTEHIGDLPSAFDTIFRLLKKGGLYFNNHDNYYSPCGSHDHGFWFYGSGGAIEFQGIECWTMESKCAASANHRTKLLTALPWTWSAKDNLELSPENCYSCRYYKRAQPWAHLRFVDEFSYLYNDKSFVTPPRQGSSLNKITPFILRQLLNEAGFRIIALHRTRSSNIPEQEILDLGFSYLDLTTQTVVTLSVVP